MQVSLGIVDTIVLILAVATAVYIGLRARGQTNSVEAFLLGDRNLPWWAILGSIVATETSTATVLSLPGVAFGPTGMKFLQLALGYLLGRTVVAYLLLPLFFQGKLFSAYEVLEKRFGSSAKNFASILFLIARNLGDGLRLFLAALVLQKLVGWPFALSACTIGFVTILYTYFGGMRSVVWNDCIQLVIYMLGGVATVFVIANAIPGGWEEFWRYAGGSGKLQVLQWTPTSSVPELSWFAKLLSDPFSVWAAVLGGAVLTVGTHGTDQMMVQRYLSARSAGDARRAILLSAVVVLIQFALFLFIGVQLACFYSQNGGENIEKADEVYAHFIVHSFPSNTGLIGLMLAAILSAAMSTLSSSLNASASALINDFYLPWTHSKANPKHLLRVTRRLTIGFGILQIGIGIWATTFDAAVVSNALTIAGYSAGILLGLFALGTLTRRVDQTCALGGACCGLLTLLTIQFLVPQSGIRVAWPWFALIGSTTTFVSGLCLSIVLQTLSRKETT